MGAARERGRLARVAITAAAVAASMGVVACSGAGGSGDDAAKSDKPIRIMASLPLTGPLSVPGQNHKAGYEYCADEINKRGGLLGRQVELKVSDNRSDPETIVSQVQRFINVDKADLLLGTFSTLLSFPASSIAEQNQMVWLEPSDSAEQSHSRGYKYNFGFTLKPINYIGQTPVDAIFELADKGDVDQADLPKTAAVVYQDDFFPNSISLGLVGGKLDIKGTDKQVDFGQGYLADKGIKVVYKKQYPGDFNDWVSMASQIKKSGADYLFALTQVPTEVNITKALSTVGYKPKGVFYSQGTYPEFKEALGKAVNGIIVWSTWAPDVRWEGELNGETFTNQDFVAGFKERTGKDPDEDHAQAFTACQALAAAVNATKSLDNTKLRDWIADRTASDPIKTIQGPYHFDEKGLTADRDVLLLQWQDGELRHIFPTGDEYPDPAKIQWPMPNW
jgi:branched-chain amino acid transport system substrate-binding protein